MGWPEEIIRIPTEEWTKTPLEDLAKKYDSVEQHGWYDNLIPTVQTLLERHNDQSLVIDYSGGTGILVDRIFRSSSASKPNILIVDSSPKFLRLALEKNTNNPQVGFRLIQYLRSQKRLQYLNEVLEPEFYMRKADGLVSTNAIHLYYQLPQTLISWKEALRTGAHIHIQSGNIRNKDADPNSWIIDETIEAIHQAAKAIVQRESAYDFLQPLLQKEEYMKAHDTLRNKYFLPVRSCGYYTQRFSEAGFDDIQKEHHYIQAKVSQWYDFLVVYHEGVLGWVGGAEKITKEKASDELITIRKTLIRQAMNEIFFGKEDFQAVWTYFNLKA